ncbi:MAG TPA: MOSC domain-containing protein [Thermoanaerobaculia bacterium]|nr:MOSC domain-containing protein [Thermoanaerobaculia bacterium]
MGEIEAIWIKRAHRAQMDRVDEATLVAGRGLKDSADQGGWRQVTIISEEAWRDAVAEAGKDFDPSHRRANVMVRGIDLEDSRGKQLRLGACVVNIRGENPPCKRMGEMQRPLAPHWRAGVFGEIVAGGTIRVGDSVSYQ